MTVWQGVQAGPCGAVGEVRPSDPVAGDGGEYDEATVAVSTSVLPGAALDGGTRRTARAARSWRAGPISASCTTG